MKSISNNIIYILLLFILPACTEEMSLLPSEEETTVVNLHFTTRATIDSDIELNEGIKTLRVILVDADWNILQNVYQSGLGNLAETTVVLKDVPKAQIRFLVIANEESMGRSFDTFTLLQDLGIGNLKNIFNRAWEDNAHAYFPKMDSEIQLHGLPMTGVKGAADVTLDQDGGESHNYNKILYEDNAIIDLSDAGAISQTIEIPLVRCVAKLVVNIENRMDESLTISAVRFGRFFSNKAYYYAHSPFHMPYGTNVDYFNFEKDIKIEANSKLENALTVYFYPVSLPNDNDYYRYSISFISETLQSLSNYQV